MKGKDIWQTIGLIAISIAVGVIVVKGTTKTDPEIGRRFYVESIKTQTSCVAGKQVTSETIPVDVIYDSGKVKSITVERVIEIKDACNE